MTKDDEERQREERYSFELLINESRLVWHKFAAFLLTTSILLVGFIGTEDIFLKTIISSGGVIFTILLFIIVKISWDYHDLRWKELKKKSDLNVFTKICPSNSIRSRDAMYILYLLVFIFWLYNLMNFVKIA